MTEITNTSDSDLNRSYDGKWRESRDAKIQMMSKASGNCSSSVPQSDVDAIANAMDAAEQPQTPIQDQKAPILGDASDLPAQNFMPSKEQAIDAMMQNYVRQNGGIVVQDNQDTKKDQTLFG